VWASTPHFLGSELRRCHERLHACKQRRCQLKTLSTCNTHSHTHTRTHKLSMYMYMHIYKYVCMYVCIYINMYIYVYIYTYIYICGGITRRSQHTTSPAPAHVDADSKGGSASTLQPQRHSTNLHQAHIFESHCPSVLSTQLYGALLYGALILNLLYSALLYLVLCNFTPFHELAPGTYPQKSVPYYTVYTKAL
jgi:hypothetical protein